VERFIDFLLGVGGGGIELFFLESLRPGRGGRGWSEGRDEWMGEKQEQCEWKSVHRKPVSGTWIGGVNERKGAEEEVGSLRWE
jgi:hypothetical protein